MQGLIAITFGQPAVLTSAVQRSQSMAIGRLSEVEGLLTPNLVSI